MNVLLVDDEQLILDSVSSKVKELLKNDNIVSYSNAEAALEYVENNKIDIAILDINMRVISGIEIARSIQKLYPKVNIIFATGYSEYALDALDLDCSQYLLKPITVEKLEKALNNLRYPINNNRRVRVTCFGNFEIYVDNNPVEFKYSKSKELLAYLIHNKGSNVATRTIINHIFDENQLSYFSNVRNDLIKTLEQLGIDDVIRHSKGLLGINVENIDCDYYDYLNKVITKPRGKYMANYEFV